MQGNIRIVGSADCEYSSDAKSFYKGYWSQGESISSFTRTKNQNILDHYFPDEIKNKCIVELGVGGEGGMIVHLKDTNQVFGIDASGSAAQNCKQLGVEVIELNIDASKLPFDGDSVDIVFGFEVFEHLSSPQFVIEEVYRILKKYGVLLLTTPNPLIHHWPRLFYLQRYEKKSFREFLMINKFNIREQANIGSNMYSKRGYGNIDEAWSWTWYCNKIGADQADVLFKYGRYF